MPKRIEGLADTILDQASLLFSRVGYDAVDMKQVAAAAGTSVGNLYNYHASKPALFLAIKSRWKENLIETCQQVLDSDRPRRDKILAVLGRLYDDVSNWHGLWSEFLRGREERTEFMEAKARSGRGPWGLGQEEQSILNALEILLTGHASPDPVARWALVTMMATLQLAARYPDHRDENWKFIETLVDKV